MVPASTVMGSPRLVVVTKEDARTSLGEDDRAETTVVLLLVASRAAVVLLA